MLTKDELLFLQHHGFSADDVYDAKGRSPASCKDEAKRQGKSIIIGTPCGAKGHRLRGRSGGHCAQCRPAILGYAKRNSKPAQIYIAVSDRLGLIKVGSSEDATERAARLNFEMLGGASDWRMVFYASAPEAGRLEFAVHKALANSTVPLVYNKGEGRDQISRECFKCSALKALNSIIESSKALDLPLERVWRIGSYDWTGRAKSASRG
jgi:hypothetical protein